MEQACNDGASCDGESPLGGDGLACCGDVSGDDDVPVSSNDEAVHDDAVWDDPAACDRLCARICDVLCDACRVGGVGCLACHANRDFQTCVVCQDDVAQETEAFDGVKQNVWDGLHVDLLNMCHLCLLTSAWLAKEDAQNVAMNVECHGGPSGDDLAYAALNDALNRHERGENALTCHASGSMVDFENDCLPSLRTFPNLGFSRDDSASSSPLLSSSSLQTLHISHRARLRCRNDAPCPVSDVVRLVSAVHDLRVSAWTRRSLKMEGRDGHFLCGRCLR